MSKKLWMKKRRSEKERKLDKWSKNKENERYIERCGERGKNERAILSDSEIKCVRERERQRDPYLSFSGMFIFGVGLLR